MTMRGAAAIVVAALLSASCSMAPTWTKPGASDHDLVADWSACRDLALYGGGPAPGAAPASAASPVVTPIPTRRTGDPATDRAIARADAGAQVLGAAGALGLLLALVPVADAELHGNPLMRACLNQRGYTDRPAGTEGPPAGNFPGSRSHPLYDNSPFYRGGR